MYKLEKNKPFYATLKFLSLSYHYPTKNSKAYLSSFFVKFSIVQAAFLFFYCGGNMAHLILTLKETSELDNIREDLTFQIVNVGNLGVCALFTFSYKEWSKYFNNVSDTSKFGKPADFDAVIKRTNFLSTVNFLYANGGVIFYGIGALLYISECKQLNEEKGLHELCGTFTPIWLPIKKSTLLVIILFPAQMVTSFYSVPPAAVVCFLPLEASEILISHVNHFKLNFPKIFEEPTYQRRRDRLNFFIKYHHSIISMANHLNALVKFSVGMMTPISALIFACLENQIFNKVKPVGASIYLIASLVWIFLLCHAGQRIKDETLSMSDVLYDANWYEAEVSIMKDLPLIIARAQHPHYLDTLPLGTLNYALFVAVLKTSYSYMTLLNQTA